VDEIAALLVAAFAKKYYILPLKPSAETPLKSRVKREINLANMPFI